MFFDISTNMKKILNIWMEYSEEIMIFFYNDEYCARRVMLLSWNEIKLARRPVGSYLTSGLVVWEIYWSRGLHASERTFTHPTYSPATATTDVAILSFVIIYLPPIHRLYYCFSSYRLFMNWNYILIRFNLWAFSSNCLSIISFSFAPIRNENQHFLR